MRGADEKVVTSYLSSHLRVIVFQPAPNVMAKTHPRVVSLLPSATDILAVAGAVDLLVGRSHE